MELCKVLRITVIQNLHSQFKRKPLIKIRRIKHSQSHQNTGERKSSQQAVCQRKRDQILYQKEELSQLRLQDQTRTESDTTTVFTPEIPKKIGIILIVFWYYPRKYSVIIQVAVRQCRQHQVSAPRFTYSRICSFLYCS